MSKSLNELEAKEVLKPDFLEQYLKRHAAAWQRLLNARTALFILGRILAFPFDLFGGARPLNFWKATEASLVESCVLRFWQLAREVRGYRLPNLLALRDLVVAGIRDEFRPELEAALKAVEFETPIKETLERVKTLRNKVVAHMDEKHEDFLLKSQVSLEELLGVGRALAKLFDVLSFGVGHGTVPLDYMTKEDGLLSSPSPSDIDELLLLVAKESYLLNLPETYPDLWQERKEKLTAREREALTVWRGRAGLPKVT